MTTRLLNHLLIGLLFLTASSVATAADVVGRSNLFCLDTRSPFLEVRHQSNVDSRRDVLLTTLGGVQPVRVCADGSRSTVFRIRTRPCLNAVPADYVFRLASTGDAAIYGAFSYRGPGPQDSGTLDFLYQHPATFGQFGGFVRNDTVQVRFRGTLIHEIPIQIYRAPVLMLHGLWGDASGFATMAQAMQNSWAGLIRRENYPNDRSFTDNRDEVRNLANRLLDDVVKTRGYSAGSVDVVAHSMGGIVTRIYLQEPQTGPLVRSLLTIDTPHWGSHFANWLMGGTPGSELSVLEPLAIYLPRLAGAPLLGSDGFRAPGVRDLAVRSAANNGLANGANRISAPMHFVASQHSTGSVTDAMRALLVPAAYLDGFRRPLSGPLGLTFWVGDPDAMIAAVFGGRQHDEIVPLESQLGGLPTSSSAVRVFDGPHHVGVQSESAIIAHVMDVLNQPRTNNPTWSARVQPVPDSFDYSFPSNRRAVEKATVVENGVTITQPSETDSVTAGQTVTITVEGVAPFQHIVLGVVHNESVTEQVLTLPVSETVTIPISGHGPLVIMATGLTTEQDGPIAFDYVALDITPDGAPTELTVSPSLGIALPLGQTGYFSADTRYPSGALVSLRNHPALSTTITDTSIARIGAGQTVETLAEGETELVVQFGGLEQRVRIQVLPADAWGSTVGGSAWFLF